MSEREEYVKRADMRSGRWFGVKATPDRSQPPEADAFTVCIGAGYGGSGVWNTGGPPMPREIAERLVERLYAEMAPIARLHDEKDEAERAERRARRRAPKPVPGGGR